ncbi:MAG: type II toxin-antitoxin system death-on-curing family toxin [Chloroflexi bacterium]|nr:type II toxin-antitoxin system death-on-curing family toxin [Chloroflexota bacterium]
MRYLTLAEVLALHRLIVEQTGGAAAVRDLGALESAVAQPRMTFEGRDLYATLAEKAVALGFSIIQNHPFVDGNKRVGHAAMETFLVLNGRELRASIDESERVVVDVASGKCSRGQFLRWVEEHLVAV